MNRRKEWDDLFLKGKIIEDLGDNLQILHMEWKSPSRLVHKRDFVTVRIEKKDLIYKKFNVTLYFFLYKMNIKK